MPIFTAGASQSQQLAAAQALGAAIAIANPAQRAIAIAALNGLGVPSNPIGNVGLARSFTG